jgi:hypothetical protein
MASVTHGADDVSFANLLMTITDFAVFGISDKINAE